MKLSQFKRALATVLAVLMLVSMFAVASADNAFALKADSLLTLESDGTTNVVVGLSEKQTVADLLANFDNSNAIVASKNGEALAEDAIVGTGVALILGEDVLYVVVKGDADGSGTVDSTDYLQIKGYFLGNYALEGLFYAAADTTNDGEISTTDYVQIKSYFLGIFDLYPEVNEESSEDASIEESSADESVDVSVDEPSSEEISIEDSSEVASSEEESSEESSEDADEVTYIVHKNKGTIHIPDCSGAKTMSESNKVYYTCTLDELLAQGFKPCGTCNAGQTEEESSEASSEVASSEEVSVEESSEVASSEEESSEESSEDADEVTYIVHKNKGTIHIPDCSGAKSMSESNKVYYTCTLDELLAQGFKPCGTCKAGQTEESSEASSEVASSEEVSVEESSEESSEEADEAYAVVTDPQVDTAYKFGLNQVKKGQVLYFTGEMSGYYLATTQDKAEAVDVYLETAEGGYYLYFVKDGVKNYINIVERDDSAGKQTINLGETAISVYVIDEATNVLYTTIAFSNDTTQDFYLGTYGTYNTISSSKTNYIFGEKISEIGVNQFPAFLLK